MATLPLRIFALLATIALLPAADAATFSFGTIVSKSDWDYTPNPAGTVPMSLCFNDDTQDGVYNPGEPLTLDVSGAATCPGSKAATDDIRIIPIMPRYAAGSLVVTGDEDTIARPFTGPATHLIRYVDIDNDLKFKAKDTLYIDLFGLTGVDQKEVNEGDVRLTPFKSYPAGSIVQITDPDVNFVMTDLAAGGVGFGSANAVYKAGSAYYVNTDMQALATTTASTGYNRDYVVEENDVRLNAKAENPLGDFNSPAFTISDATVVSEKVVAGKWLQLKVTLKNAGKAAASGLVETYVDDVLVDSRGTATIAPGKEGSVVIGLPAPEEAGRAKLRVGKDALVFYTVEAASGVAGSGVGTSSLEAKAAPETQAVEPVAPVAKASGKGAPGVPLLAMLGLVGVLAWMRRRSD